MPHSNIKTYITSNTTVHAACTLYQNRYNINLLIQHRAEGNAEPVDELVAAVKTKSAARPVARGE